MAGGEQDVLKDALPVQPEAALHRPHLLDASDAQPRVPGRPLPQLLHVLEEGADGRVVAVANALEERRGRAAMQRVPNGQSRPGGREAVPVALRAHLALSNRRGTTPPGRGRVDLGAEDGDLLRLDPAVEEGRVGDEADQSAADDRAAVPFGHFTEPARSPCTK